MHYELCRLNQGEKVKAALASSVSRTLTKSKTAESICDVLRPDFRLTEAEIKRSVKDYFRTYYSSTIKSILATPLLIALGEKMDERGIHIDSVRFYEWAIEQAHNEDKKIFELLRVKKLEDKDGTTNLEERRKIKIGPIDEISKLVEVAKTHSWERIYSHVLTFLRDIPEADAPLQVEPAKEQVPVAEEVITNEEAPQKNLPEAAPIETTSVLPTSVTPIQLGEFEIQYNPKRRKVVIRHIEENVSLSIKKNAISKDDLEIDENGYLMLDEKKFDIQLTTMEDNVSISLMHNGVFAGVKLLFAI